MTVCGSEGQNIHCGVNGTLAVGKSLLQLLIVVINVVTLAVLSVYVMKGMC